MANAVAIVGDTGTGKSSSMLKDEALGIKGLDPKETFIINVKGKPLPFRGWKSQFTPVPVGGPPITGNYLATSDSSLIIKTMQFINTNREDIKNVVLDDGQYIMSEEFMANALKSGFDKFNKMAKNMYDVINTGINMRDNINFVLLTHSEELEGKTDIKTLGKMLSDKVNLAGLFTVVIYTNVKTTMQGSEYTFITNQMINDRGIYIMAKSPRGMFEEKQIPNDLGLVLESIENFNNG